MPSIGRTIGKLSDLCHRFRSVAVFRFYECKVIKVAVADFAISLLRGGRTPFAGASAARNLEIDSVIAAVVAAAKRNGLEVENWTDKWLESLSSHIVTTHQAYVKRELPSLAPLAQKADNRQSDHDDDAETRRCGSLLVRRYTSSQTITDDR